MNEVSEYGGKEKRNKPISYINPIFQFQQLRAAETCMTSTPPKTGEYMPLAECVGAWRENAWGRKAE